MKKWIWIAGGLFVVAILCFLALMGTAVYMVMRNVEVAPTSERSADQQFEEVVARYHHTKPFITVDEHGAVANTAEKTGPDAAGDRQPVPLETLRIMAWDPEGQRMARVSVPLWVLRLTGREQIRLGSNEVDLGRLRLTVEDLERHGPGLVLDHTDRHGERLLIWAE